MSDRVDPSSDPELAALAKRDHEVAEALEAERRGRSGDFNESLSESWDQRTASDARWDAAALGVTIGEPLEVHRRDGSVFRGKVAATADGRGWWRPVVEGDSVVFEDGTHLTFDDIVSVSTISDADHEHDLGPAEEEPPSA
jgi:hypothetical protein